jgi:serine-type D-Ala-D-Ala carboxypeptidase/endopeptidase
MRNIILLGLLSFLPILTAAYASEFEHGSKLNHQPSKVSQKLMDQNMEALLEKYVKKTSAGVVAAIIDQENVNFFACGKKSVNGDELVSDETIFEIGSITKVFTSSVLMDMVHKEQVHLDDPIDFYLVEVKIPQFENKKITFRHLATHTSGLPPLPDNFDQTNVSDPYQNYTTSELYEFLNHYELKKSPGEACYYSNLGMGLLGHVLSVVAKKSYEELVVNTICNPLGMKKTGVQINSVTNEDVAIGHNLDLPVGNWNFDVLAGCGALRSNVKDMAKFLSANMGVMNTPLFEVFKECHQIHVPFPGFGGMALGWQVTDRGIICHTGGTGGFLSFIGFNPKNQRGVVLLSNSADYFSDDLTVGLLDPENFTPEPPIDEALTNLTYLKQFEGVFETIASVDDSKQEKPITLHYGIYARNLWVWTPSGDKGVLKPNAFGIFCTVGAPEEYYTRFVFDENGKIIKVQLNNPNGLIEAFPKVQP